MANGASRSLDLGAISERLHSNEVNLQRLGEDTNRQIRDLATATQTQINSLATATTAQTNQLGQQISKLDNSLQERGKIQWPAFALLLSAITAIGWLAYNPINAAQNRIESQIIKLADTTPSSREIAATGARRDDWQRYAEERFKKVEGEANEHQKAIVPRGEHEEKWRSVEQRFADHQRQLDAIKADFSGLYRPRDALESIQRRLEFLESGRTQAVK